MALQGTLDTFALIDVFRLLASTNKTGRLRVTGDRGNGNVWFDGGGVVLAAAHNTKPSDAPVSVIFELLRQHEGSFVFEADVTTPEAGAPTDVENLIREAEHLLIEWQEIEAVVPSVHLWVSLATELPRPEVVVDGERWKVIVATGAGATVSDVGDNLGLGEIAVSKAVKEVIEIGLLTISDPPAYASTPRAHVEHIQLVPEVEDEPLSLYASLSPSTSPSLSPNTSPTRSRSSISCPTRSPSLSPSLSRTMSPSPRTSSSSTCPHRAADHSASTSPASRRSPPRCRSRRKRRPRRSRAGRRTAPGPHVCSPRTPRSTTPSTTLSTSRSTSPGRTMTRCPSCPNLTPQAARAIAAAAQAHTEAERDAALTMATGPNDEPLDRDLLLRFLSSVKR